MKTGKKTSDEAHRKVTKNFKTLKLYQSKQQLSDPQKNIQEKNEL